MRRLVRILAIAALAAASVVAQKPVYYGGPVLNTPNGVTVYVIWYGDFSTWPVPQPTPSVVTIVETFLRNIGGTPRWAMVTQWADSTGIPPVNKLTFGGSYFDTALSQGTYISACGSGHRTIQDVIEHAMANGIPRDPNAIYYVLPRGDVVTDDCNHSRILAWHSNYGDGLGHEIMYAYLTAITGSPWGPPYLQDDWWTDYVMQAVMHEIEETMIWPYPDVLYQSSWMDANTQSCIYYSPYYLTAPNGALYTQQLGGLYYKIYASRLLFGKGTPAHAYCAQALPSFWPASQDGISSAVRGAAVLRGSATLR